MKRVFLGGTCNESNWRDQLIPMLAIDYYNPVVKEWTPEKQAEELRQREICTYCLYVITPKMEGFYSIAEVIDDSNKRPEKTIFCFIEKDEEYEFTPVQLKSLEAICQLIKKNEAVVLHSLAEIAPYLNRHEG